MRRIIIWIGSSFTVGRKTGSVRIPNNDSCRKKLLSNRKRSSCNIVRMRKIQGLYLWETSRSYNGPQATWINLQKTALLNSKKIRKNFSRSVELWFISEVETGNWIENCGLVKQSLRTKYWRKVRKKTHQFIRRNPRNKHDPRRSNDWS